MRDAKELFGRIAQTNHYQVNFSELNTAIIQHIRTRFGVSDVRSFVSRKSGILCSEAVLPTSGYATAEVKGDFMGVPQEFAHTRLYTDIDFTFYIDSNYNNLRFFEGWIDYIASGSGANEYGTNYYRRMKYPDHYKCSAMSITKFERNMSNTTLSYKFINTFPKLVTAVPVSYGGADVLRVSVSFNYDRYIVNPTKDTFLGEVNTFDPDSGRASYDPSKERELIRQRREQSLRSNDPNANTGTGRDGTFGSGTSGKAMPSNPPIYSRESTYNILLKRNSGDAGKAREQYYEMFPDERPGTSGAPDAGFGALLD